MSKKTPKVCVDALDYVINGEEKKPKYENPEGWEEKRFNDDYIERTTPIEEIEKFIEEYDFYRLFGSSSYYFGAANPVRKFHYDSIAESYKISTRADLKNYTDQIEKFIEYIKPYVEHGSGYDHEIFAYVQYEEDPFPKMYGIDGVYANPTFDGETKRLQDRIGKLYDIFSKLYQNVCPDWNVNDIDYEKHNTPLKLENGEFNNVGYDTIWDWMVDHIIEEHKKKNNEDKKE